MAVAAYASLVSLTHVLDNLHYRAPFQLPHLDIKQIEALKENVHYLLEFVEHHSERGNPKIEGLWGQMSEVAFEAEDMIDLHVVNQLHMRSQEEIRDADLSGFCKDIEEVISKMDLIKKATEFDKQVLLSIEEEEEDVQVGKKPSVFEASNSSLATSGGKKVVVGVDEHVFRIMGELTRSHESDLQILSVVGMAGIGKTTLARTIFDHQHIIDWFDMCLWVKISQEYSEERILMCLLGIGGNKETCDSLVELGVRLHKRLFNRRFLIVMDDVWSIEACKAIIRLFPNNRNGSRILLTSRQKNVDTLSRSHNRYSLSFLDKNKSWDLFCQTTFGEIGCPYDELAEIGRNISNNCRGLPLEIVLIGRMLAKSNMTKESWDSVAKNMHSLSNLGDDEHCLKTLHLSYEDLPIHLKPCFLYMRFLAKVSAIKISDLIAFWIAEGFIKFVDNKSGEEIANGYAKELIDRNLIMSVSMGEYCEIHDLLRDLCFREADRESIIQSQKVQHIRLVFGSRYCFLCAKLLLEKEGKDLTELVHIFPSSSLATRFVCNACASLYSHSERPRLVRTVDGFDENSWKEIVQPFGLRHASMKHFEKLNFLSPSRLHLLWNLQTLIMYATSQLDPIVLPPEIWEMPQLRVIDVSNTVSLPDPVASPLDGEDFIVLKNLHTLSRVQNFKCTKEIVDRVPNLKDLRITYTNESQGRTSLNYSLCNLMHLQKLESLEMGNALESIHLPSSLKSLTLWNYPMAWEQMSSIGSLPNLEVLKLYRGTQGSEWEPVEGGFPRLKKLCLTSPDLVSWRADSIHFPILEELELGECKSLEEIPLGVGDIITLDSIKLYNCSDSVISSAKQIWEEQQDMGYERFKMYIDGNEYQISATEKINSDS